MAIAYTKKPLLLYRDKLLTRVVICTRCEKRKKCLKFKKSKVDLQRIINIIAGLEDEEE